MSYLNVISGKLETISTGVAGTNDTLGAFSQDTHKSFIDLDNKYHSISESVFNLNEINSNIKKLVNRLGPPDVASKDSGNSRVPDQLWIGLLLFCLCPQSSSQYVALNLGDVARTTNILTIDPNSHEGN